MCVRSSSRAKRKRFSYYTVDKYAKILNFDRNRYKSLKKNAAHDKIFRVI